MHAVERYAAAAGNNHDSAPGPIGAQSALIRSDVTAVKADLLTILRCPRCRACVTEVAGGTASRLLCCTSSECDYATRGFPVLSQTPILIDFDRSILDRDWVMRTGAASTKRREPSLLTKLTSRLTASAAPSASNAEAFLARLKARSPHPVVLVVGGAVVGGGAAALYEEPSVSIVGTDIYRSDLTAVVADGHQLPFADGSFDGVWVQAVLEHVLEPRQVVAEIHRVLGDEGYVYAETPFMQHVHEGAFDFTRFTPTGHRWLFRDFDEISSGATRGPATVLLWSIQYLVAALFRSYRIGNVVGGLFFWLQYLDRFTARRFVMDGPSAVFFLGRRTDRRLEPQEIAATYRGAQ